VEKSRKKKNQEKDHGKKALWGVSGRGPHQIRGNVSWRNVGSRRGRKEEKNLAGEKRIKLREKNEGGVVTRGQVVRKAKKELKKKETLGNAIPRGGSREVKQL